MAQGMITQLIENLIEFPSNPCEPYILEDSKLAELRSAASTPPARPVTRRSIKMKTPAAKTSIPKKQPLKMVQSSYTSDNTNEGELDDENGAHLHEMLPNHNNHNSIFDDQDAESAVKGKDSRGKRTHNEMATSSSKSIKSQSNGKTANVNHDRDNHTELDESETAIPPAKRRNWPEPPDYLKKDGINSSSSHVQSLIAKMRKLKKDTDDQLKQNPDKIALLDNYLTSALGYFEAAALSEVHAAKQGNSDARAKSKMDALANYKGLVPAPLSNVPSLLTFYVFSCEKHKLNLRSIIGRRCLAMAHCRLWMLQQKSSRDSLQVALKSTDGDLTKKSEISGSSLADISDIFRFSEYYSISEEAAKKHPETFEPFPRHPFDLHPLDFLEFIKKEIASVWAHEDADSIAATSKEARNLSSPAQNLRSSGMLKNNL